MTITYRKLLTTSAAADYLRIERGFTITRSTLETLRCRGGGPAFNKIGRKVYYKQEQLDKWLHDNSTVCINTNYSK